MGYGVAESCGKVIDVLGEQEHEMRLDGADPTIEQTGEFVTECSCSELTIEPGHTEATKCGRRIHPTSVDTTGACRQPPSIDGTTSVDSRAASTMPSEEGHGPMNELLILTVDVFETSHTGSLTESDTRALHALAGIGSFDLIDLLDSDGDAPIPPQVRGRLVDLLGECGTLHGRDIAAQGAAALNEWLIAQSGVPRLHSILSTHLGVFAAVKRAHRIIGELDRLSYPRPERDHIRDIVDRLRSDPALHTVVLFGHLEAMLTADPASAVTRELHRLVEYPTPALKLGLPDTADRDQVRTAAQHKLAWAHSQALSTFTAAEDAALVTLIHSYSALSGHT